MLKKHLIALNGGLSLPNFQYYYWDSNIREFQDTFPEPMSKYLSNTVVNQSLKICPQFRRAFSPQEISTYVPIMKNNMFTPSQTDRAFKILVVNDLNSLHDLYDNAFFLLSSSALRLISLIHISLGICNYIFFAIMLKNMSITTT